MGGVGAGTPGAHSSARRNGFTLIEVLIALGIVVFVVFAIGRVFLSTSAASSSAQARLSALKFAEMEKEQIAGSSYEDLPPEKHALTVDKPKDGEAACRITLRHVPVKRSVRVWALGNRPLDLEFVVDYANRRVTFPEELKGRTVMVSYTYEYPRRKLVVVPEHEPYRVRLSTLPLRAVTTVVNAEGRAVPVQVDREEGYLTFREQDAGKSVSVEYRGENDRGTVQGTFLAEGLTGSSVTDSGVKLARITETWNHDTRRKKVELCYVRAR